MPLYPDDTQGPFNPLGMTGKPDSLIVTRDQWSPPVGEGGPPQSDLMGQRHTPTFVESLGAAFRQENTIGSTIEVLTKQNDFGDDDPEHNPWDAIKGTKYQDYWKQFVGARNARETEFIQSRIDKEIEDKQLLAASGAKGMGALLIAGIADPINLVPGGTIYRGYRSGRLALRSALEVGGAVGATQAGQELLLHQQQYARTLDESLWNIGGATLLGAFMGGGLSGFSSARLARAARVIDEDLARLKAETADIAARTAEAERAASGQAYQAGGAAPTRIIQENKIAPAFGVERVFASTNPLTRVLSSGLSSVRDAGARLMEVPLMLRQNRQGIPTGPAGGSVETRIKVDGDLAVYRAQEALSKGFAEYRFGSKDAFGAKARATFAAVTKTDNGLMTYKAFKTEVTRALREQTAAGIEHPIPQVKQAAEAIRKQVFEPFKKEAQRLGLFPEDAEFNIGYVMRRYDVGAILDNYDKFHKILFDYIKSGQAAAGRDLARLEAELARLRSSGDLTPEVEALRQRFEAERARVMEARSVHEAAAASRDADKDLLASIDEAMKGATPEQRTALEAQRVDIETRMADEKAATARISQDGFDTTTIWFHGTDAKFKSFEVDYGKRRGIRQEGVYFSSHREIAQSYADGYYGVPRQIEVVRDETGRAIGTRDVSGRVKAEPRIIEANVRPGKQAVIDATDMEPEALHAEIAKRKDDGYDTVLIKNNADAERVGGTADAPVYADELVVFDPKNIRMADEKAATARIGDTLASLDDLGFYSKALEAAKSWPQAKGTPEQVLTWLKKSGVKDGEIEATGLGEALAGQKSVTRDDVVRQLEQGRVGLRERVYGKDDTTYSAYSLDPTNPTYRETVLHLPLNKEPAEDVALRMRRDEMLANFAPMDDVRALEATMRPDLSNFRSGHFSEPNIVGHMMTSMTSHEGRPVFTVDQIQSDWGQRLRDGGVRDEAKIAALKAQIKAHDSGYDAAWLREAGGDYRLAWENAQNQIGKADAIAMGFDADRVNKSQLLRAELETAEAATPGHPLVNTTDQWTNTTLRRAIRQAVDDGADYIAIPSGKTVLSYNPGDTHGMAAFYDEIVPKNLRNILRKIDKQAPAPIHVQTLDSPSGKTGLGQGFTLFPLTDAVKASVREQGQPLFSMGVRAQEVTSAIDEAMAFGRKVAPPGTRIEPVESLPPGMVATSNTRTGDIQLATFAVDPKAQVGHEAIHSLVTRGHISPSEVETLARLADKHQTFTKEAAYLKEYAGRADLERVMQEERAASYIAARLSGTVGGPKTGVVRRVMEFFERLKNLLIGRGFRSKEDVVNAFMSGEMAARDARPEWMRSGMDALASIGEDGRPRLEFDPQVIEAVRGLAGRLGIEIPDMAGMTVDDVIAGLTRGMEQMTGAARTTAKGSAKDIDKLLSQADELRKLATADDQEISAIAKDTISKILGTPGSRMVNPYDPVYLQGKSGPLHARTLKIPDKLIADFLDDDIERIAHAYIRSMGPDVAIAREFGDVNMTEDITRMREELHTRMLADPANAKRINAEGERAIKDLQAVAARLRGTYNIATDPTSWGPRTATIAKQANILSRMGSVLAASISDVPKLLFTHGFRSNFDAFSTLITNLGGLKMAKAEAKELSAGLEFVLSKGGQMWDVFDDFGHGHTMFEKSLRTMTGKFGQITLMDQWNSLWKQLSGVMTMNRVLRTSLDIANGRANAKDVARLAASGIGEDLALAIAHQYQKHGGLYGRLLLANAGEWQDDMAKRALQAAVRREADITVVTPGQEKPLWLSSHLGSVIGQFRTFNLVTIQRTLIAGLQDLDAAKVVAAAGMIGLGMLSEQLKLIVHGKEHKNPPKDIGDWMYVGLANSGLLGWLTDADQMVDKVTRGSFSVGRQVFGNDRPISRFASQSVFSALAGPSFGQGADIAQSIGAFASRNFSESDVHAIRRLAPYQNLWFLSRALRNFEDGMIDRFGVPRTQQRN